MADTARQRQATNEVPTRGDPDRKRVLNVLAQRRYRQRRREKLAALEAKANGTSISTSNPSTHSRAESFDCLNVTSSDDALRASNNAILISELDLNSTQEYMIADEEITRASNELEFSNLQLSQAPLDLTVFQDYDLTSFPINTLSSPLSSNSTSPIPPLPTSNFSLTSDSNLRVACLPILRAGLTIASLLNVTTEMFNPFHLHTVPPTPHPSLPLNYYPTPAQLTIPHHPVLDTLPWPSVREKLICMFALPSALRPAIARDESGTGQEGVMRIIHDMDDWKEGFKIHGNVKGWNSGSELEDTSWEVGEAFFRNWWWALEPAVLEQTNRWREERGEGRLRLEMGSVGRV